ncbi:hypothetical protein [Hymenobacter negativus]|uniref:DUF4380 domain-containing protein n=1 Tax=Hymenobacter negativus TaxID=2795026 RepID=A0ABS3QA96_9BACT|nr:hypothetical protein [Hymenobacter negativus]MBO2008174.1 hypothetical protein [Hymenobacter negativus]
MKQLAFLCLGVALLAACRKDDVIICDPLATATFADLRAAAPAVQTFTFDLGRAQSLRTTGGATISFPANSFALPNGTLATGQATLRVRELHSVSDMVLAGLHTDVGGRTNALLVSAGEFNIQFWQGATRLQWQRSVTTANTPQPTLSTPVPASGLDTTRMFLWKLPFAANGALPVKADSVGWQPAALQVNPQGQFFWPSLPASSGLYTAVLPLDSISWTNFDQYWRPTSNAVWTWNQVRVPAGASESRVYLRPAGYTSLCRTFGTNDPTLWENHFPNGTDVQAIVIQIRDGQFYFGTQRYNWQPNVVMAPTLEALSSAEVVQRIRQL